MLAAPAAPASIAATAAARQGRRERRSPAPRRSADAGRSGAADAGSADAVSYSSSRKSSTAAAGSESESAPASAIATASAGSGVAAAAASTGSGVAAAAARPATTAAGSAGANRASASARPSSERLGGASMRPVARAPRSTSSRGNRAGPCRRTSARSVPSRSTTPRTVGTNPSDSVTSPLRWTNTSSRVKSCGAAGVSSAGRSAQRRVAMAVAVSTSITVEATTWLSGMPMDECTRRSLRKSGHSGGGNLLMKSREGLSTRKSRTRHPFRVRRRARAPNAELKLRATTELSQAELQLRQCEPAVVGRSFSSASGSAATARVCSAACIGTGSSPTPRCCSRRSALRLCESGVKRESRSCGRRCRRSSWARRRD